MLVHAANIQDAAGLGDLLKRVKPLYNWLRAVFADSIYNRLTALLACFLFGLALIPDFSQGGGVRSCNGANPKPDQTLTSSLR